MQYDAIVLSIDTTAQRTHAIKPNTRKNEGQQRQKRTIRTYLIEMKTWKKKRAEAKNRYTFSVWGQKKGTL